MSVNTRRFGITATGLAVALTFTSCGKIVETAFEEGLEEAIERDSGEDVEIDFDSDGNISISGDDGEFNLSVDGEDGAVISGSDEDGEEFNLTINEEDGAVMTGTGDDGEEFEFSAGEGTNDDWPGELPLPPGAIVGSSVFSNGDLRMVSAVSEVNDPIGQHQSYVSQFLNSGFVVDSEGSFNQDGVESKTVQISSANWQGSINAVQDEAGSSTGTMVVTFQEIEG